MLFCGQNGTAADSALCFILLLSLRVTKIKGATQDQMSTRANTLLDDVDDTQRQLENEVREKLPKTVWVIQIPTQIAITQTYRHDLLHSSSMKSITPRLRRSFKRKLEIRRKDKAIKRKCNKSTSQPENDDNKQKRQAPDTPEYTINDWTFSNQYAWKSTFPKCGGASQSPVDLPVNGLIRLKGARNLLFANYHVKPCNMTLVNDGRTVVFYGNWKRENRPLIYGGAAHSRRYLFHSITFYMPSEHSIGGLHYPLESQVLHISAEYSNFNEAVAASAKDPLAFLGVINIYKYNSKTEAALSSILQESNKCRIGQFPIKPIAISELSPPFKEYVCYQGSLTVPPCTESVLWLVRSRSLSVTRKDEAKVRHLIAGEEETVPRSVYIRFIQQLNDRKVYISI